MNRWWPPLPADRRLCRLAALVLASALTTAWPGLPGVDARCQEPSTAIGPAVPRAPREPAEQRTGEPEPLPTVDEVLARHLEALGGIERIERIETIRTVSEVEAFGLSGTSITWNRRPNLVRNTIDLGFLDQTAGYDGTTAWKVDVNGKVSRLDGMERDVLMADGFFGAYEYCFPGRNDAEYRVLGWDESDGEETVLLEVTPPGLVPFVLHFDPRTWLVAMTEADFDFVRASTTYEDYRSVAGVRVPFAARQTTGDPRFDLVSRVSEVRFDEPLDPAHFAMPSGREMPGDCRFLSGHMAEEIPLSLANRHIYVEVEVNGSGPRNFILDTGASASVISTALAEELDLETRGRIEILGAAGKGEATYTLVDSLRLPGLELRGQRLIVVDLAMLRPFEGIRVDGILGYDFISRFVLMVDYEAGMLCAHDPATFHYDGPGEVLDIVLEGNVPVVEAVVDDQYRGPFLLDTGAAMAVVLNQPFVEENRLLKGRKRKREIYTGGVGGVVRQIAARLDSFALGSVRFPNVPAVFGVERTEGIESRRRVAGIIGGALLDHFTLYLDYGGRRVILEPNARTGEPVILDCSGLQLILEGETVVVAGVANKSPGDQAGIREGDRILLVDGEPAAALGLPGIRDRFRECAGTRIRLRLIRSDKARTVTLRLRNYH